MLDGRVCLTSLYIIQAFFSPTCGKTWLIFWEISWPLTKTVRFRRNFRKRSIANTSEQHQNLLRDKTEYPQLGCGKNRHFGGLHAGIHDLYSDNFVNFTKICSVYKFLLQEIFGKIVWAQQKLLNFERNIFHSLVEAAVLLLGGTFLGENTFNKTNFAFGLWGKKLKASKMLPICPKERTGKNLDFGKKTIFFTFFLYNNIYYIFTSCRSTSAKPADRRSQQ